MADAGAISVEQLVKLSGLTDRRLRELADEEWFPRPVRNQYPLVEAIAGLLRHYRDQHDNPPSGTCTRVSRRARRARASRWDF